MAVFGLLTPDCALLIDRRSTARCRSPPHCVHRRGRDEETILLAGVREVDMANFVLWRVWGHCLCVGGDAEVCGEARPSASLLLGAATGVARTPSEVVRGDAFPGRQHFQLHTTDIYFAYRKYSTKTR
jgi:hypothetical protein